MVWYAGSGEGQSDSLRKPSPLPVLTIGTNRAESLTGKARKLLPESVKVESQMRESEYE